MMKYSKCCGSPIKFTDICSECGEHCDEQEVLSFSEWLEINHNQNNGWKLDKNGNVNDQNEFDELYEEYTSS
jgi:hypothetical protein